MVPEAIGKAVAGQSLTQEEAAQVMTELMAGEATPAQIGALLIALRMKGETVSEVAGLAQTMRSRVVPVRPRTTPLLDTCGTGGSTFRVFNVSTCAAFVAAAAGIPVAKHGNRASSGVCGSADVLEALGVAIGLAGAQCADCIDAVGIAFLFAPGHHPAMKHVAAPRREIGVRTVFNLLGPLSNPAGATRQTMGVYEARLCPLAAGALGELGSERAIVAHGDIGLDEIATLGVTHISELRDGHVTNYTLTPHDLGLHGPEPRPEDLAPATTPQENAQLVREVLTGTANDRAALARLDLVAVNAAASLRVAGLVEDWPHAVEMARSLLRSGKGLDVLERLIAYTRQRA